VGVDEATQSDDERPVAIDARLLADERFGVMFILWLVGRATVDAIDRRIQGTGMSADEFPVYCLLDIAGPLTPSALGTWMAAPATTVSSFVKRLEERGHAARRPNQADRRSYLLELTDAGRTAQSEAIEQFAPLAEKVERELGRATPRVRAELLHLRRIFDGLRETEPT
jgi:DNA-binding MarR family transcriptional regulator